MIPKRSASTHTEQLGDEASVYEWTRSEVHSLNRTAARIWSLCDGTMSDVQIAETLGRESDLPHAEDVVRFALAEFSSKHLLASDLDISAPSRRALLKRLGKTAALLPVVTSIVAPTPLQAQSISTGSQTFGYTGVPQTFLVPAGVTRVTIAAQGAAGGNGGAQASGAGLGGSVTATLPVTAGATLNVYVGGQGSWGGGDLGLGSGLGGFNGGGNGTVANLAGIGGGGGGGASDVRRGGVALTDRVVVAGGGAGGSGRFEIGIPGGGGGGTTGQTGASSAAGATGGGGGTQAAGGAGGTGSGTSGAAGSLGIGGNGGPGGATGGGGGGGGYYGGGGGAGGPAGGGGGGGGGGSSYTDPTATGVTHLQGVRSGNGQVVISW